MTLVPELIVDAYRHITVPPDAWAVRVPTKRRREARALVGAALVGAEAAR
ncbi:hypothetical protein [Pseudofrankia sp. BMG5.36]|nr:hypothetical protein [Pseudofrankia sp. BMG5.36]